MTSPLVSERPADVEETARALQALVSETADELRPGAGRAVGLDDPLEAAGIDSLGRAQLLARIERRFGVRLPDEAGLRAVTARELLAAIVAAPRGRDVALAPVAERPAPAAGALELPAGAATLLDVLAHHAAKHGDRVHLVLHRDEGPPYDTITYGELRAGASHVAAGLEREGVLPDDAVAIMLPTGREYFLAFFGVLLAGAVPAPIYPPVGLRAIETHLRRQGKILANARAVGLITDASMLRVARLTRASLPGLRFVSTVPDLAAGGAAPRGAPRRGEDLALLQYTSGSTGDPKGVALTHANLLANIRAMGRAARVDATDVIVSWLPLYHDMGLIGTWLGGLYHGVRVVVLSPLAFIARPQRWLEAIHAHGGTISAAPNFAYGLCATKLDDAAVARLDLSSWRLAFNGSEPVAPRTLEAFARRFAPCGLRPEALTPVYGLAESSVGLCFPPLGRGPRTDRVRRDELARDGRATPAAPDEAGVLEVVSCGRPIPGHEVRVVDEAGREAGEREVGRVEMRGPSMTRGYRDNEPATRALLRGDGWLDTGDCGYMAEGELFLTGRQKDIVIRAGRKVFPSELEAAVGELPGVRKGGVAVFAARARADGAEQLVVVAETRLAEDDAPGRAALRERIAALAVELLQVPADAIELVAPRAVPKTANGKVRRGACRELWEQGQLGRPGRSVAAQVARLLLSSLGPRARRAGRRVAALAFGAWAWLLVAVLAPPAWLAAIALPTLRLRRAVVRALARALFLLARVPLEVRGLERVPATPCVVVSNHASYLDSILLFAVLPPRFAFAAKRELAGSLLLGPALRRLGVVFVERRDAAGALEDTTHLSEALRRGDSLAVFAEGTFERAPGLLPFHLGGFVVAARAGAALVPVALRGTRALLRGEERWPRRGPVVVSVGAPREAAGTAWEDALGLRDAARAAIAQECGEPDLLAAPVQGGGAG